MPWVSTGVCAMNIRSHLPTISPYWNLAPLTTLLLIALVGMMVVVSGSVAAQDNSTNSTVPSGGDGGDISDYEAILTNLYQVAYLTLKWIGLATLVFGAVVWWTARRNSQRAETGMKLVVGGAAMTVLYFGLDAVISVLEFIAGA